jgi:hypothetical protein
MAAARQQLERTGLDFETPITLDGVISCYGGMIMRRLLRLLANGRPLPPTPDGPRPSRHRETFKQPLSDWVEQQFQNDTRDEALLYQVSQQQPDREMCDCCGRGGLTEDCDNAQYQFFHCSKCNRLVDLACVFVNDDKLKYCARCYSKPVERLINRSDCCRFLQRDH